MYSLWHHGALMELCYAVRIVPFLYFINYGKWNWSKVQSLKNVSAKQGGEWFSPGEQGTISLIPRAWNTIWHTGILVKLANWLNEWTNEQIWPTESSGLKWALEGRREQWHKPHKERSSSSLSTHPPRSPAVLSFSRAIRRTGRVRHKRANGSSYLYQGPGHVTKEQMKRKMEVERRMGKKEQINWVAQLTSGGPPGLSGLRLWILLHWFMAWQGIAYIQSAWPEGWYPIRWTCG